MTPEEQEEHDANRCARAAGVLWALGAVSGSFDDSLDAMSVDAFCEACAAIEAVLRMYRGRAGRDAAERLFPSVRWSEKVDEGMIHMRARIFDAELGNMSTEALEAFARTKRTT